MLKDEPAGKKTGLAEQGAFAGVQGRNKKRLKTQEEYKDVVKLCRKKIIKLKVQLEFNLGTAVRDNKKSCYKYINIKRRVIENLRSLLDVEGEQCDTFPRMRKRLRYLIPSLPQSLKERPVSSGQPAP